MTDRWARLFAFCCVFSLASAGAQPVDGPAENAPVVDEAVAPKAAAEAVGTTPAEPVSEAEVTPSGEAPASADGALNPEAAPDKDAPDKDAPDKDASPASAATASGAAPAPPEVEAQTGLPPELAEFGAEVASFTDATHEYRQDILRLVAFQRQRRQDEIQNRYGRAVDALTVEERQRREDAIGRFEEFVRRYPHNPKYSPGAIFRLAELHFEKSNDAYVTALEDYDVLMDDFEAGQVQVEPTAPEQDYRRTIGLFDRLIRDWPEYKHVDGAYYLKGYCLLEMGEDKPALDEFLALTARFPNSRFIPETWTRIGEYYFDYNKLPEAIAAYSKVVEFKKSGYYDKALYKLAWTYYRNDEYINAIERFRELIEFSDERAKKTGLAGSDLRLEAIEYLAISLQEDDWDGDTVPDEGAGFPRVMAHVKGDKPYDVEILRRLADIFFDNAKYPEAIDTIRYLLASFPKNEENPALHAKMVTAFERLQRFDEAFEERAKLADAYGADSVWQTANQNRTKAVSEAEELMEDALIQAAQYHHSRAQQLRGEAATDAAAEERAIGEYHLAAKAYELYLARYPKSENTYDLNFFYAECLFYSFRFAVAREQYAKVRDSKLGDKYRELAAFSAILSQEQIVRSSIEKGEVDPKPSLTGQAQQVEETQINEEENDGLVRTIEPEAIPTVVEILVGTRLTYIEAELNDPDDRERQPRIAYTIGSVYFDYKHYDEARKWFRWLIEHHPRAEVAAWAGGNVMETYRRENNWDKMAKWADELESLGVAVDKDEINILKVGALFKGAQRLFNAGKYEDAATEYVRLIETNPGNKYEDAALNNAAVAYEKTRRFESATRMYERLYRDHPDSRFAESALFRLAVNAERFYDYDKAIGSHLALVKRFKDSTHRADALYQAALLQEQTQQYRSAAVNYERYVKLFPMRKDAAETFYQAARTYEKLKDTRNQIRIYQRFEKSFGKDPKQNVRVIESLAKTALIYKAKGQFRAERRAWQRVIDEFNRRGMQPGSFEAAYPARAQFELVEIDFKRFETLKLAGSLKNQGRIIQEMQKRIRDLSRRYSEVLKYKSFDWTLAAFYRLGQLYQLFAEALYEAPIPDGFSADDEDMYRTQLEDIALPIEDEAVKRYEQAYENAREFRISNVWTIHILTSLNKYKPADYPLFKQEHRIVSQRQLTPPRLLVIPKVVEEGSEPSEETPGSVKTEETEAPGDTPIGAPAAASAPEAAADEPGAAEFEGEDSPEAEDAPPAGDGP